MLYKAGVPPYFNVIIMTFLTIVTLIFQIYLMSHLTVFKQNIYIKATLKPVIKTLVTSCIVIIPIRIIFSCETTVNTLFFCVIAAVIAILCTYFIGFTELERKRIVCFIKDKNKKHE